MGSLTPKAEEEGWLRGPRVAQGSLGFAASWSGPPVTHVAEGFEK